MIFTRVMGRLLPLSLFSYSCLIVFSCAKPTEGCLDIRATNFNAAADENCCCTYPQVKLIVSHAADTLFQSPDSIYTNDLGQAYRLLSARFYLSDFIFYMRDVGAIEVADTILLTQADGSMTWVKNDVIQIQRSLSSYSIGTLVTSGKMDSISFQIGLLPAMTDKVPSDFPTKHPLNAPLSGLYVEGEGYKGVATAHWPQSPPGDTLRWTAVQPQRVTLATEVNVAIGYNIEIPITINYLSWLAKEDIIAPEVINVTEWLQQIALSFRYGNL